MLESPLFKRFLVGTIMIISLELYTLIFVPERIRNGIELIAIGLIILVVLMDKFTGGKYPVKLNFRVEIILFLLATLLSMFMANGVHGQSFGITLMVQRFMYFYFFYFFLHSIKIKAEDIRKLIIPFGLLYVALYAIQYAAYPTALFDTRAILTRGTMRLLIPGMGYALLAYYMSLQSYLKSQKLRDGILVLVFFSVIALLQGTRQVLASVTFVTILFIFFNKEVKSRTQTIFMVTIAAISVFFIFESIIMEMIVLTEKQTAGNKTNIRLVAMRFYLTDYMTTNLAYIFGNGQDSLKSEFGQRVWIYRAYMGLHQSDIGIIGEYSKFGLLFLIAQLSIRIRLIFGYLPKELAFIRYYMIGSFLTMFGGVTMFGQGSGIVFLGILLYMVDLYIQKEKDARNEIS